MRKRHFPTPPSHNHYTHSVIQDGITACHIWIFTDKGARTIETLYGNAAQIMEVLGTSRATAYRLIKRHPKRYWCMDYRNENHPTCYSVLPLSIIRKTKVQPIGNPNFHNGMYQQMIARRPRTKKR